MFESEENTETEEKTGIHPVQIIVGVVIALGLIGYLVIAGSTAVRTNNYLPENAEFGTEQGTPVPSIATPELVKPASDDTLIFPGESVYSLIEAGSLGLWEFEAREGEILDIIAMPHDEYEDDFNLVMELYGADGNLLLTIDNNAEGKPELIQGYKLPASGNYSLWVSENGFDNTGYYIVTLMTDLMKNSYPLRITPNRVLKYELKTGQVAFWLFSGQEGDVIDLKAESVFPSDRFTDIVLEIFAPDGSQLVKQNENGREEPESLEAFTLPQTGNYTMWVYDDDFNEEATLHVSYE